MGTYHGQKRPLLVEMPRAAHAAVECVEIDDGY